MANAYPRLRIHKVPSGGQADEQIPISAGKGDATDGGGLALLHGELRGTIDVTPKMYDGRVCRTPCVHDALQFLFLQPHLERAHFDEGPNTTPVSTSQFSDLALGTQMSVLAVLDHGNTEHLAGRLAVDVSPLTEQVQPPLLASLPGQPTGLD